MEKFCNSFVISIIVVAIAGADYCDEKLCSTGQHIACRHNGKFASTCPKDAALVKFDKQLKELIVTGFNEKRNLIAGGGNHNHKPACRMATVQWDHELSKLAELNVRQCEMKKEECHNTKAYPKSGQNLSLQTFEDKPDYPSLIKNSLQMWYDEVNHSKMEYIKKYPEFDIGAVIAHFITMVAEPNIRVGCAAATYPVSGECYKSFLMACNFAFTYVIGKPVYSDCIVATSNCTTGRNPKYPNLCSTLEKYDVS